MVRNIRILQSFSLIHYPTKAISHLVLNTQNPIPSQLFILFPLSQSNIIFIIFYFSALEHTWILTTQWLQQSIAQKQWMPEPSFQFNLYPSRQIRDTE